MNAESAPARDDPVRLPASVAQLAGVICGCATVETTWQQIIDELERLERKEHRDGDDLACALADWSGMSEHGTAIRAGWLTDEGREALDFLRRWGADWRDRGEFVDDEGIHHGCL